MRRPESSNRRIRRLAVVAALVAALAAYRAWAFARNERRLGHRPC